MGALLHTSGNAHAPRRGQGDLEGQELVGAGQSSPQNAFHRALHCSSLKSETAPRDLPVRAIAVLMIHSRYASRDLSFGRPRANVFFGRFDTYPLHVP